MEFFQLLMLFPVVVLGVGLGFCFVGGEGAGFTGGFSALIYTLVCKQQQRTEAVFLFFSCALD